MIDQPPESSPFKGSISIPDDGEVAPLLATIVRAYCQVIEVTEKLRRRILSDRIRSVRRTELFDQLIARIKDLAQAVAELAVLDGVRPALKGLGHLPALVRPRIPQRADDVKPASPDAKQEVA